MESNIETVIKESGKKLEYEKLKDKQVEWWGIKGMDGLSFPIYNIEKVLYIHFYPMYLTR